MPKGWTDDDPDKGKPYRHTRAKIRLMLDDPLAGLPGVCETILLKIAEKRPEDVLDALLDVLGDGAEDFCTPALVCTTHRRFIPCRSREQAECAVSALPSDIERVRAYQSGTEDNKSTAP